MLQTHALTNGIVIKQIKRTDRTILFSTNITLLKHCITLSCDNDNSHHSPTGSNTEAAAFLAENLVKYAQEQWNMDIERVFFAKNSVEITVRNPGSIKDSWDLLEKAVRTMCLSLVVVYQVKEKKDSGTLNTLIEYKLQPQDRIFTRILSGTNYQTDKAEEAKICIRVSKLPGVEELTVLTSRICLSIANVFADPVHLNELEMSIADIIREEYSPNIVFTNDMFVPAALINSY